MLEISKSSIQSGSGLLSRGLPGLKGWFVMYEIRVSCCTRSNLQTCWKDKGTAWTVTTQMWSLQPLAWTWWIATVWPYPCLVWHHQQGIPSLWPRHILDRNDFHDQWTSNRKEQRTDWKAESSSQSSSFSRMVLTAKCLLANFPLSPLRLGDAWTFKLQGVKILSWFQPCFPGVH